MVAQNGREHEGLVAVVTGSARNIGRAIALDLAEAGAAVVVHARSSQADARAVAAEIEQRGGRASVRLADLTTPEPVRAMVDDIVREFGRIDILVNNAASRADTLLADISFEEWRRVQSSIVDATFLCSQACAPQLAKSGRGSIITLGGTAAHTGIARRVHVVAAKTAVVGMTRALAAELAEQGTTVNCVSPGHIDTKRDHVPPHFAARPAPINRPGKPEEIAAAVRFLTGPDARYITGQTLEVNGGWHMG